MFRILRHMPYFKLLSIAQLALVARRHLGHLDNGDRRRLGELVRRGREMDHAERDELRRLLGKLEPGAFAAAAVGAFVPGGMPRRLLARFAR